METSPRTFKKIRLADEGEDTYASNKLGVGLAECGDMDRQLSQVASATLDDIPIGLLDEIFQNIYFSDLLGVRR